MDHAAADILSVLDRCCDEFTFPMLDNGYVYLAATRLSLHRSDEDWAMVIEVFGFSPRAGLPQVGVHSFGSRLHDRDDPGAFASAQAYQNYLAVHPHDDSRYFEPVAKGDWQDAEELVAVGPAEVLLRGRSRRLPALDEYAPHGIELEDPSRASVFELCRYLAAVEREFVLATSGEQRVSVRPDMTRLLQLEEWHHPNVVDTAERPSGSETFVQLARVLETGAVSLYQPTAAPNTHWRHWPEGGTL
jgi:hypothetical protein